MPSSPPLQKLKVLAVDDHPVNLEVIRRFLEKLGHQVTLATDGESALRCFESEPPDLVLLDLIMPGIDGFEVARRLKGMSAERWLPIIVLSALEGDENMVAGLEAGADDYLTKPINLVILEAKLHSIQRTLRLQQQAIDARRRTQAISDHVIDAIVTIDENGLIASVNRATEQIFGWRADEMLGRNVSMLMPEPDHSDHDRYLRNYQAGQAPKIIGKSREVEALTKEGRRFPIALGVTAITLENKPMYIGLLRDISQRKAAERQVEAYARQLQAYYDHTQSEQQLAMHLMEQQLHRQGLQQDHLHYRVIPAENFSGDIVGATRSDGGSLYAILADATGHGLAAAISALPVLAVFYEMSRNDRPLIDIIEALNRQLIESMPIGRFVAATLVRIDQSRRTGEIWVGGTPQAFLMDADGAVVRNFASANLPLGIAGSESIMSPPCAFAWDQASQLMLCSDGLIEACNEAGEQFGCERLCYAASEVPARQRLAHIESKLAHHLGAAIANDDVSLLLIDCR